MKNDKTKLIIWAVVALVIGVIIGTFLVAPVTTGNAKSIMQKSIDSTKFNISNNAPFKFSVQGGSPITINPFMKERVILVCNCRSEACGNSPDGFPVVNCMGDWVNCGQCCVDNADVDCPEEL